MEFSLPEDDESEDNVASIGAAEAAEDAPTKEQKEEKEEGKEKNVSADSGEETSQPFFFAHTQTIIIMH